MSTEKHEISGIDVPPGWSIMDSDPVIILHPRVIISVLNNAGPDKISEMAPDDKRRFREALDDADASSIAADFWTWLNRTCIALVLVYSFIGVIINVLGMSASTFVYALVIATIVLGFLAAIAIPGSERRMTSNIRRAVSIVASSQENDDDDE